MKNPTISLRISHNDLALALDGLTNTEISPGELNTISSIVRTVFYHGILSLHKNNIPEPSIQSLQKIKQFFNQNSNKKSIGIKNLLK